MNGDRELAKAFVMDLARAACKAIDNPRNVAKGGWRDMTDEDMEALRKEERDEFDAEIAEGKLNAAVTEGGDVLAVMAMEIDRVLGMAGGRRPYDISNMGPLWKPGMTEADDIEQLAPYTNEHLMAQYEQWYARGYSGEALRRRREVDRRQKEGVSQAVPGLQSGQRIRIGDETGEFVEWTSYGGAVVHLDIDHEHVTRTYSRFDVEAIEVVETTKGGQ